MMDKYDITQTHIHTRMRQRGKKPQEERLFLVMVSSYNWFYKLMPTSSGTGPGLQFHIDFNQSQFEEENIGSDYID